MAQLRKKYTDDLVGHFPEGYCVLMAKGNCGSVAILVEARPPAGILSCVAARSHRASFRASWATVVWKRQHQLLAQPYVELKKMIDCG